MKVVEETFRQLLQKGLCLWRKQIFVYIDEGFAINRIRPFLSLLLTGKIHIGVTERGSFKKYSKAAHNIKLPFTYTQNLLACAEST